MFNVIIGFSKKERCEAVKDTVVFGGYSNITLCTSGDEILRSVDDVGKGIIICGYKVGKMVYSELERLIPLGYGILVLLSQNEAHLFQSDDIFSLVLPVNKIDLIKTVDMVLNIYADKENGSEYSKLLQKDEKIIIEKAKLYLMNKYKISENAAYKFIQKTSMSNGLKLSETANRILKD